MKKTIITILAVFAVTYASFSQEKTKDFFRIFPKQSELYTMPNRFWVDLSVQTGFMDDYFSSDYKTTYENTDKYRFGFLGFAGGINLHYLTANRRHIQVRVNYMEDFLGGDQMRILDNGLLFGWMFARKYMLMEIATGISCLPGHKRGESKPSGSFGTEFTKDYFVTVGIPFEADIKFMYKRYAGLGLVLKANLNPEWSYGTLGVELTINGPN